MKSEATPTDAQLDRPAEGAGLDGWTPTSLGDCCQVTPGYAFKSAAFKEGPPGARLLRGDNVSPGATRWDRTKYWERQDGDKLDVYELRAGDVVLAMDRPWIEAGLKVAIIAETDLPALLVQRVARLRATQRTDQQFLGVVARSEAFSQYLRSIETGTTIPHISKAQIEGFRFALPPLAEQVRIAWVLGTLDRKEQHLCETATTAHKMVEASYQLAVGNADTLVPTTVGELVTRLHSSVTPEPNTEYAQFSIPAYDNGLVPEVCAGSTMLSAKNNIAQQRCVLFSKLNPHQSRVWWVEPSSAPHSVASPEFVALTENQTGGLAFAWAALRMDGQLRGNILGKATGTTGSRQRVKHSDVLSAPITVLAADPLATWGAMASSVLAYGAHCLAEAQQISELRNALLPGLMSGAIRVPDTKDVMEAVGAATEDLAA